MTRLFFLCFLLLSVTGEAHAMSKCLPPENIMKAYPVVFKGTAIATETLEEDPFLEDTMSKEDSLVWLGKPQLTTFRIVEGYKGGLGGYGAEVKIFHWSKSVYDQNETYVVFVDKDEQGRLVRNVFCNPGAKAGTIDTNGKEFSQLKIYNHQAQYLRKLIAAHPDNPYFYLEQAVFHEKYDEFALAEQGYKTGLMKATGKSFQEALANSAVDPTGVLFINGYNRLQQRKSAP